MTNQASPLSKGLIQIYTGDGKGKTSAALGLALRACGNGLRVKIIFFMKGANSGEREAICHLPGIDTEAFGQTKFVQPGKISEEDIAEAGKALAAARESLKSYDVVILDEACVAAAWKLIEVNDLLLLMRDKPAIVELVLTGRYADFQLIKAADLVTEMVKVKHPYDKGIPARKGIDY